MPDKEYWGTDWGLTDDEWARLDLMMYGKWDLKDLQLGEIQTLRRDLLELSLKVTNFVGAHEEDEAVMNRAAEIDLNVMYLLRDLDWKLEGLI